MTPTWQVHVGDVLEQLTKIPDGSVQTVVTSPPYFALRSYLDKDDVDKAREIGSESKPDCVGWATGFTCGTCYVCKMVAVFTEVWRVLRDDGTVFLNLGDSYAAQRGGTSMPAETMAGGEGGKGSDNSYRGRGQQKMPHRDARAIGLKHKDMIGVPWRVAFALQAAGWYLRRDVIWAKNTYAPESVTDRPTTSHEYIFFLAKSERYYFDALAVREKSDNDESSGHNIKSVWTINPQPFTGGAHFAVMPEEIPERAIKAGTSEFGCCATCGTGYVRVIERGQPNRAHQQACGGDVNGEYFGTARKNYDSANAQEASATKARILAGMVEKTTRFWRPDCCCHGGWGKGGEPRRLTRRRGWLRRVAGRLGALMMRDRVRPCLVLDPFTGSGTTGRVSIKLGRSFVGTELNKAYEPIWRDRIGGTLPLFSEEAV